MTAEALCPAARAASQQAKIGLAMSRTLSATCSIATLAAEVLSRLILAVVERKIFEGVDCGELSGSVVGAHGRQYLHRMAPDSPHRPLRELRAESRPLVDEAYQPAAFGHELGTSFDDRSGEFDLPQLGAHPPRQLFNRAGMHPHVARDHFG